MKLIQVYSPLLYRVFQIQVHSALLYRVFQKSHGLIPFKCINWKGCNYGTGVNVMFRCEEAQIQELPQAGLGHLKIYLRY